MFRKFKHDKRGQLSIWYAIMALPLLAVVTFALDIQRAESEKNAVLTALDSAALAAISAGNMSDEDREQLANNLFVQNFKGNTKVKLSIQPRGNVLRIKGEAVSPTSVVSAFGHKGIPIEVTSEATRTVKDVICVLALNPTADAALKITGNVKFFANNCSVQVNSNSATALVSETSRLPSAESFCAVGGVSGSYSPFAKSQCSPVADPYANLKAPEIKSCKAAFGQSIKGKNGEEFKLVGRFENGIFGRRGNDNGNDDNDGDNDTSFNNSNVGTAASNLGPNGDGNPNPNGNGNGNNGTAPRSYTIDEDESLNLVGNEAVLSPGTYCGGLTIFGSEVTLLPGNYFIVDGKLSIKSGAQVKGNGVTFIHKGILSRMEIEENARVRFIARNIGPLAGFVFFQDARSIRSKRRLTLREYNEIRGDSSLYIVGTAYFPKQKLVVSGASDVGADSPVLSLIADQIEFSGDARLQINVEEHAVNFPEVLPRSDEGARLKR